MQHDKEKGEFYLISKKLNPWDHDKQDGLAPSQSSTGNHLTYKYINQPVKIIETFIDMTTHGSTQNFNERNVILLKVIAFFFLQKLEVNSVQGDVWPG